MLKPGGFAVLPVPLVGDRTIEYPGPVATEFGHVRAPGYDYYERYKSHFSTISTFSSEDFDEQYQVFVYEDRSRYPTKSCPYRILVSRGAPPGRCPHRLRVKLRPKVANLSGPIPHLWREL